MSTNFLDKLRTRLKETGVGDLEFSDLAEFKSVTTDVDTVVNRMSTCSDCSKNENKCCSESDCYISVIVKIPRFECPLHKW